MITALVLSGGSGTRMGMDTPKQYIEVNGRSVISYCLETLLNHETIDAVQIVADEVWQEVILRTVKRLCQVVGKDASGEDASGGNTPENSPGYEKRMGKLRGFSVPGKTRQCSILNGLHDIRKYAVDSDYVLIHDAARPLLPSALITDCICAIKGHDGVLPVLPMKDTVYVSKDGRSVSSLLERSNVFAGQAPELFALGKYYEANRRLLPDSIFQMNGSTEPAVMAGMDIVMIPGDERNFKLTTAVDLERFREIIQKGKYMA